MSGNFEISYTKDGERKTFSVQENNFDENDEWRLVVERFNIVAIDQHRGDKTPQTYKTRCLAAGYSDVTYIETP